MHAQIANARKCNDFQEGIDEVRVRLVPLVGRKVTMDSEAFNGWYGGPRRCTGVIVAVRYDGPYVASVQFEGEGISSVTSASFMLASTEWQWDQINTRDDAQLPPAGAKHVASMQRATRLVSETLTRLTDKQKAQLSKLYFIGLDGNGEDRRGYELGFAAAGVPVEERPAIITVELDPNVAFANALRFGRKNVRYSAGDVFMRTKRGVVNGIERAITTDDNEVLSKEEKDNCIALYLDYCGSPQKQINYHDVYGRLPQLVACGVTVAKRQGNRDLPCSKRRKLAAPPERSFSRIVEYNHAKVMCDVYAATLEHKCALRKRALSMDMQAQKRSRVAKATECIGKEVHIAPRFWKEGPGCARPRSAFRCCSLLTLCAPVLHNQARFRRRQTRRGEAVLCCEWIIPRRALHPEGRKDERRDLSARRMLRADAGRRRTAHASVASCVSPGHKAQRLTSSTRRNVASFVGPACWRPAHSPR